MGAVGDGIDWIEPARRLLPAWIGWAYWIWLPIYAAAAWASAWICRGLVLRGYRRAEGLHWTERARAAFPARAASSLPVLVALISGLCVQAQLGAFSRVHPSAFAVLVGTACYLCALVTWPGLVARLLERPVRYAELARSHLVFWLMLMPMMPLGSATALLLPSEPGLTGGLMLALGSLLCLGVCWGGAIPIALAMRLAAPAGPRLGEIVGSVARRMGVSVNGVYEIALDGANALAYPLGRAVLFTERALVVLNDDEIAAIAAHELGHVSEPRSVALGRVVPVVYMYFVIAGSRWLPKAQPVVLLAFGIGLLLMMLALPALARRLERRADAAGLAHEEVPGLYAAALERIGRDNLLPAVMPGRAGSHPHLYDRLASSDRPPSYPRPDPPSRFRGAFVLAMGLSLVAVIPTGAALARAHATDDENGHVYSLAFWGGGAWDLKNLGWLRSEDGDSPGAATFLSAASALLPNDIYAPSEAAIHWSQIEHCSEARLQLEMARSRVAARPSERHQRVVGQAGEDVAEACPSP